MCQRVSVDEYDEQGRTGARACMTQLLEHILDDHTSSDRVKKKRIKRVCSVFVRSL